MYIYKCIYMHVILIYICTDIYMHIYTHIYIYIFIYIYVYMYVYMCAWVCVCFCVCVCIYKYFCCCASDSGIFSRTYFLKTHTRTQNYINPYLHISIHRYACIYIYVYTHTIDWFWLPIFPTNLVRGLSNNEMSSRRRWAMCTRTAPL